MNRILSKPCKNFSKEFNMNEINEKYTFEDLLRGNCFALSKIEIPIIQRDYVQGQKAPHSESINKTGKRFIEVIFESMRHNIPMDLDFIYGSITADGAFIPLDGQQRLTTLFLLYWYLTYKCFSGDHRAAKLQELKRFSYETRVSSREFCRELCSRKIALTHDKIPSAQIKNEGWFFAAFKRDPTVAAMLNMLDEIHRLDRYYLEQDYNIDYTALQLLRFSILPLDHFGLTEELYLKMNARGKPLSVFEIFKADLEKTVYAKGWEQNDPNQKNDSSNEMETFSFKADRAWTDLFWGECRTAMDDAFLNFIAEYMVIALSRRLTNPDRQKKEVERIQRIAESPTELAVSDFSKETFNELKNLLNLYTISHYCTVKTHTDLWQFSKSDETLFAIICRKAGATSINYQIRVLFYAQSLYLKAVRENGVQFNEEIDVNSFGNWMRVIRNIVRNTTIDSVPSLRGALYLVEELAAGCMDIYRYLSTVQVKSEFAKAQVQEEVFKARHIQNNNKLKDLFFSLEENNFCKGKIYFALYCSGINIYNASGASIDMPLLQKIQKVFDSEFSSDNISDPFRSLLFTCGDNCFYTYWYSWSYGTKTHKYCCIESTEDLWFHFSRRESNEREKDILKEAIIKLTSGKKIHELLADYRCPPDMPNWKKHIIKHSNILTEHCSGHFFGVTPDEKKCYLYEWRKRPASCDYCYKIE